MQTIQTNYELIYTYLKEKYMRATIGKKELASELGVALGTIDLYMSRGMGVPPYKKLGDKPNSRVVFSIVDVAQFLSSDFTKTL